MHALYMLHNLHANNISLKVYYVTFLQAYEHMMRRSYGYKEQLLARANMTFRCTLNPYAWICNVYYSTEEQKEHIAHPDYITKLLKKCCIVHL